MDDRFTYVFLIHYHEIGLKGKNRRWFEQRLVTNIQRALADVPIGAVRRLTGRIVLDLKPDTPREIVTERLRQVFGIANFSEAACVRADMEAIREAVWALAEDTEFESFKIATKRSDKAFPLNSVQINQQLGAYVQERTGAAVRMADPDLTCFVELSQQGVFVYGEKVSGPGGLPVGVGERAVSLLSSGIDSPVASYRLMRRGVQLSFVHFHSQPYTDRNSQRNTEELVRVLTQYQYRSTLYAVAFADIQKQIVAQSPPPYRVLLYRRQMFRIAERIGMQEGAQAIVTGESVGQVASQTLTNIRAIGEVVQLPVLRPLAGDNKDAIISEARRIGTYEISIEPYQDACSLFVPKHPETRADLDTLRDIEAAMDLEAVVEEAIANTDVKTVEAIPKA